MKNKNYYLWKHCNKIKKLKKRNISPIEMKARVYSYSMGRRYVVSITNKDVETIHHKTQTYTPTYIPDIIRIPNTRLCQFIILYLHGWMNSSPNTISSITSIHKNIYLRPDLTLFPQ